MGGNADTGSGDFLGTTDNQPLELGVNDAPALRIEPAVDGLLTPSPNLIGGNPGNSVGPGVFAATIAGGGHVGTEPADVSGVTDNYGTVGGGGANHAGDGAGTTFDRQWATVAGGSSNTASGEPGATVSRRAPRARDAEGHGHRRRREQRQRDRSDHDRRRRQRRRGRVQLRRRAASARRSTTEPSCGRTRRAALSSSVDDQFTVRSAGGARFYSGMAADRDSTAGVCLASGGGTWT